MKFQVFLSFIFLGSFFAMQTTSCTKDKLPEVEEPEFCDSLVVSYQMNIKPIVDTYCAYSGCHDGSAPGNFLTYAGMTSFLDDGSISNRVVSERDMPPSYANAGLTELPEEEYNMMNCWIIQGYPE